MLKQRAFNATLWSGSDILLRQGLQFVIAIVLARMLHPSDYGLFGLVLLFSGVASVFADGGFSAALIQRQDTDHADESTVFWFNGAMGVLVALLLCVAAPFIAAFYAQPRLVPLTVLMAANVLLGALGAVHATLLTKRLDFRTQAQVGFIAVSLSGALAIWMAWRGDGVWALAAQATSMSGINTILLWAKSGWKPAQIFDGSSVRKLFAFGGFHFASTLMDIVYVRLYTIPIGKIYGIRALGYYTNADNVQQMPGGVLVKVFTRVAFPMFASASHDIPTLRRGMQMAIRAMMLINAPMMLGMTVVAEPMVRLVFGSQWMPSVPMLRVLCIAGLLLPLHVLNLNCLMAMGLSREMFHVELGKKVLGLGLLCVGTFFGVMGVAWSMVALSVLGLTLNARYARQIGYGLTAQVRDFFPTLAIGAVMAGMVAWLAEYWHASDLPKLIGLTIFGVVTFFGLALLARLDALHDVTSLFRKSYRGASEEKPA
jgi:teichuronic acid exporter